MKRLFAVTFLSAILLAAGVSVGRTALAAGAIADEPIRLINPIGGKEGDAKANQGQTDWNLLFGHIIQVLLGVLGSITLAVFMYGGFLWLTSMGNEEKVTHGLETMFYAALGIFIIFGAYAILNTIFKGLSGQ